MYKQIRENLNGDKMRRISVSRLIAIISILSALLILVVCSSSDGPNDSPGLVTSADELNFDSTKTELTFTIASRTSDEIDWTAVWSQDWLDLDITSGTASTDTDEVRVSVIRSGLETGSYTGLINIESQYNSPLVSVAMDVPSQPTLAVSRDRLLFRYSLTDLDFNITNSGPGTLTWNITEDINWLELSTTGGTTTTETDLITATVDRSGLDPDEYSGYIYITSDGGDSDILTVMNVPWEFTDGADYFPMAEGDTWYFTGPDDKIIKRIVSGDTTINSITCVRVLENDTTAEAWTKDGNGFYVHLLAGIYRPEPPLAIPFDLVEGTSYQYNSRAYFTEEGVNYYIDLTGSLDFQGYVDKTVPAGTFEDAIMLYYDPSSPEGSEPYHEYYGKNVGLLDNGDYILDSAYIGGVWYKP